MLQTNHHDNVDIECSIPNYMEKAAKQIENYSEKTLVGCEYSITYQQIKFLLSVLSPVPCTKRTEKYEKYDANNGIN